MLVRTRRLGRHLDGKMERDHYWPRACEQGRSSFCRDLDPSRDDSRSGQTPRGHARVHADHGFCHACIIALTVCSRESHLLAVDRVRSRLPGPATDDYVLDPDQPALRQPSERQGASAGRCSCSSFCSAMAALFMTDIAVHLPPHLRFFALILPGRPFQAQRACQLEAQLHARDCACRAATVRT